MAKLPTEREVADLVERNYSPGELRAIVREEVRAAVEEVLQAILARAGEPAAAATDDVSDDEVNELLAATGYRLKGSS